VFILVRHAHAIVGGPPGLLDVDRPLSERGWQQAKGLAENLAGLQGARLLASSYLRAHQTLTPLANRSGSTIETHEVLGHPARAATVDQALADPLLEGAVLCLHGETVNALIQHWLRQASVHVLAKPAAAPEGPTEEGAAWIVVDDATGRSAHYLRPLHVGPVLDFVPPAPHQQDRQARPGSARHLVSALMHHRHSPPNACTSPPR
jgi:phosphohistidine phosphatase SixA